MKNLIKVNAIGMVNIISGEKVVPELIQQKADDENIYIECKRILSDNSYYTAIKRKLSLLKEKLGQPGASARAAGIIYRSLNEL
jgi:lipid-A-disaccharide synthase